MKNTRPTSTHPAEPRGAPSAPWLQPPDASALASGNIMSVMCPEPPSTSATAQRYDAEKRRNHAENSGRRVTCPKRGGQNDEY